MSIEMIGELIYWFVLHLLILYAVDDLVRKSRIMSYLFMIAPLFFLPLLLQTTFTDWFNVLKFSTLMIGPIYIAIVRFHWSPKWVLIFCALLLPVNITEAVLKDWQLGNIVNMISGIIVIGLLPTPNTLKITQEKDTEPQVSYPLNWISVGTYTIWHCCFMYGFPSFRGFAGDYFITNIPTLIIPIVAVFLFKPQDWFQSRAYTLTFIALMTEATVVNHPDFWPLTPNIYNANVYAVFSTLTLVLIILGWVYMARYLREDYNQTIFGSLLKFGRGKQSTTVEVSSSKP